MLRPQGSIRPYRLHLYILLLLLKHPQLVGLLEVSLRERLGPIELFGLEMEHGLLDLVGVVGDYLDL